MTYKYIITQSLAMLMSLASNAFEVKSGQMVDSFEDVEGRYPKSAGLGNETC